MEFVYDVGLIPTRVGRDGQDCLGGMPRDQQRVTMVIQCPVCYVAMRVVVEEGIEIDTCSICHGVWLDAGELESLAGTRAVAPREVDRTHLSALRCPRCAKRTFAVKETSRGEYAMCIECRGVFVGGQTIDELSAQHREPSSKLADAALRTPDLLSAIGDLLWLFGSP